MIVMDITSLDNLESLDFLDNPDPALITGLVSAATILGLVFSAAVIVFCIFYLFKFEALKDWVNGLAGDEEIVRHLSPPRDVELPGKRPRSGLLFRPVRKLPAL